MSPEQSPAEKKDMSDAEFDKRGDLGAHKEDEDEPLETEEMVSGDDEDGKALLPEVRKRRKKAQWTDNTQVDPVEP
jgi:hypothetical protein